MNSPHPNMCWWCHTRASGLPAPGKAPGGAYDYLCGRCVERRPASPMDALAVDIADEAEKRMALLCLKGEEAAALRELLVERIQLNAPLRLVPPGEPSP